MKGFIFTVVIGKETTHGASLGVSTRKKIELLAGGVGRRTS